MGLSRVVTIGLSRSSRTSIYRERRARPSFTCTAKSNVNYFISYDFASAKTSAMTPENELVWRAQENFEPDMARTIC